LLIVGTLDTDTLNMVTPAINPPPSRNGTADLMKGSACLLMIQVHILGLFIQPEFVKSPAGQIGMLLGGPAAAPVFMAVMGWFLAETTKSAGQLAWHGIKIVGLGFLLNLGLNVHLLISISRGEYSFLNPWHYVFGVDILFLAGLSILLLGLWRGVTRRMPEGIATLVALVVIVAATPWVNSQCDKSSGGAQYLAAYFGGTFAWSYFPVFPWAAYILLGMVTHGIQDMFHERSGRGPLPVICLIVFGAIAAFTGEKALAVAIELPEYYHHGATFLIWTVVFLVAWWALHSMIERNLGGIAGVRYVKWLGRNITAIYVFQWLIIGNLATAVYQTVVPGAWLPCWIAVTIASSAFTMAWLKFTKKPTA